MKKGQFLAIAGFIAVTILLYLAARTPKEPNTTATPPEAEQTEPAVNSQQAELDAKVAQAVEIIQSGEGPPMQAIGLLREVNQADSNHVGAIYWLGEFSMMSGQFEKAITRFYKLTVLEPNNAAYCIKLAQAYHGAGQTQNGVDVLDKFLAAHPSDENKEQIDAVRNELSVQL